MNNKKILVVDDEINVCKSIRQAILKEDYEVDTALSGEEALKKDADKNYDLIITDLMMPGISGLDLLKTLKKKRTECNIIIITGYPTIKTAVESIKIGAFDYIPKPFTPADLRSVVFRAIKKMDYEKKAPDDQKEIPIPSGLYYMIGHTWLKPENKSKGKVGLMADFFKSVGKITGIELPKPGQVVSQGEICATLSDDKNFIHRIWSPASGKVITFNKALNQDFSPLLEDPYGKGWLFTMELTNFEEDIQGLVKSK